MPSVTGQTGDSRPPDAKKPALRAGLFRSIGQRLVEPVTDRDTFNTDVLVRRDPVRVRRELAVEVRVREAVAAVLLRRTKDRVGHDAEATTALERRIGRAVAVRVDLDEVGVR